MTEIHDLHDDAALEALLREALDRAGRPAPFRVDVADTVMARVAAEAPAGRFGMGWRQFSRWALAASLIGAALLVATAWHGPSVGDLAHHLGRTAGDTMGTAAKLSQPAATLASALGRSAFALFEAARTLAQPLDALRPLAQLALAVVAAAMAGFTAVVVGRDLRPLDTRKEQA
jgi:hypothetical protein